MIIATTGSLRDIIAAEPVIRYMREKNKIVQLFTPYPRVFLHLSNSLPVLSINKLGEFTEHIVYTIPDQRHPVYSYLSYHSMHPVDFISLNLIQTVLPDKQIKIVVTNKETEKAKTLTSNKKYVVVHPGKSWESKTFPKEWWNSVIETLSQEYIVVIIGKTLSDTKSFVDVTPNNNCIDMRDKYSLGELFGILQSSHGLVSNDAAPVLIASALNVPTILINPVKNPKYIFAERDADILERTTVLGKEKLWERKMVTLDKVAFNVNDFLPYPEEILNNLTIY